MRYIIILVITKLFGLNVYAQVDNSRSTSVNINNALTGIVNEIRSLDKGKVDDVAGSPFLLDSWEFGTITTTQNIKFVDILLMYDHFNEQLVYKKTKSDDSLFVNMQVVKGFSLFRDSIKFVRYDLLSLSDVVRYYQIVYEGQNLKLLRETKKEILQFDSDSSSPTENQRRFITRDRILLLQDGAVCEVKKRRKKALDCFSEYENELGRFVKNNKLDFGNEPDLIKILKKFEELQIKKGS